MKGFHSAFFIIIILIGFHSGNIFSQIISEPFFVQDFSKEINLKLNSKSEIPNPKFSGKTLSQELKELFLVQDFSKEINLKLNSKSEISNSKFSEKAQELTDPFLVQDLSKAIDLKLNSKSKIPNSKFADSLKKKTSDKVVFKMKKSPLKAVLYSAILPGAGQFYNESYWKIPVIAGLGGYFVYEWIKNNNTYLDYKQQYSESQTPQNPSGNQQLLNLREFYSDQRDNFIIYSVILYVINLIDAYVDAQLYDFNVSDKIKLGILKKEKFLKLSYDF